MWRLMALWSLWREDKNKVNLVTGSKILACLITNDSVKAYLYTSFGNLGPREATCQ